MLDYNYDQIWTWAVRTKQKKRGPCESQPLSDFAQRLEIRNQRCIQLRFVNFDTNYLSQVPYIFQPLEPLINAIKDSILWSNSFVNLPWWCVLAISALAVRLTIFPLILVQMKRFSKIGPISPLLVFLKEGWAHSTLPFFRKLTASIKVYRDLCKQ